MNNHMKELVNGEFEYEGPCLLLSEESISLTLKENEKYTGSFRVGARDGRTINGIITSDHQRILLAVHRLNTRSKLIEYGIDLTGMKAGEELSGTITVTCDLEERSIPVHVSVKAEEVESSSGSVEDLDDFCRLASVNFREAFSIFINPKFVSLLTGKNSRYLALYQGLSRNPVTYQHLEEFLIASGKKNPVRVSADKEKVLVEDPREIIRNILYLTKSTWGYVHLEIESLGGFLEIPRKTVTSEDFIGSTYGMEYLIHPEKLRKGHNYGKIRICNIHEIRDIIIEVLIPEKEDVKKQIRIHQLHYDLQKNYLDLLSHQTNYPDWIRTSWEQIQALQEEGEESAWLYLWMVMLCDYSEENRRGRELLAEIGEKKIPLATYEEKAAYLYYVSRMNRDSIGHDTLLDRLNVLINRDPTSFRLRYYLIHTDELMKKPDRVLHTCEEVYQLGNRSPFLYAEAARIYLLQAGQLRRLTPFTIRVLIFMEQTGMLNEAVLARAAYLSLGQKSFQPALCRFLMKGYEKYPKENVLEAVCRHIMLGKAGNPDYFIWYKRAIEAKLRITRLYEHYVETLSPSCTELLPQSIRVYFSYSNTLSSRKKAQLYANIVRHEKEDPDTWNVYRDSMERFAAEQLKLGRIDADYAVLYQRFMKKPKTEEEAGNIASVLFTGKLTCDDSKIRKVIVRNAAFEKEQVYVLENKTAYIQLAGSGSRIFLEDEKKRRFAVTVPYQLRMLFADRDMAEFCGEYRLKSPELLLYLCQEEQSRMVINEQNFRMYEYVSRDIAFCAEYRDMIRRKLLTWYLEHTGELYTEEAISNIEDQLYARVNKADTIEVLVEYGQYERAFALVDDYGCEQIKPGILMRLVTNMLRIRNQAPSEELLYLAIECWKRRIYDEVILAYLNQYYEGSCTLLSKLWEDGRRFHLENEKLEEKLLNQILSSRSWPEQFPEILESYIQKSGREELILGGMIYACYGFFLDRKPLTERLFYYLEKMAGPKWRLPEICRLALLSYYCDLPELKEAQIQKAKDLLSAFIFRGYRFAGWQKLPEQVIGPWQLVDPVFIEARYPKHAVPVLHYRISDEWKEEPMAEIYPGIFNREFLIFYGETVEYYISCKLADGTVLPDTRPEKLQVKTGTSDRKTRYSLINDAIAARALNRTDELKKIAAEYTRRKALAESCFPVME